MKKRWMNILLSIVNIVLIISLISTAFVYFKNFNDEAKTQSISELTKLNENVGKRSGGLFLTIQDKVNDAKYYIVENNLNYNDSLSYLAKANSDSSGFYELISIDLSSSTSYKGIGFISGDCTPINVDYSSLEYEDLQKDLANASKSGTLFITSEFTDSISGFKVIASSSVLKFDNIYYQLMYCSKTTSIRTDILSITGYDNTAMVSIIDSSGKYVINSIGYQNENFYDYLLANNNISYYDLQEIKKQLISDTDGLGHIIYNDSSGEKCIYVYSTTGMNMDWFTITKVKIADLDVPSVNISLVTIISVFFVLILILDGTWFVFLYHSIHEANIKMNEATKVKAQFFSSVSHDMRTPMNGIIGMSEIALESKSYEELMEYIKKINSSSKYLLHLINDTLDISKLENNKLKLNLELVSLKGIIEDITDMVRPMVDDKKLNFDLEYNCRDIKSVYVDKIRVIQIFVNILSNAIKFTPSCGKISISIDVLGTDEDYVTVKAIISDTGCGMSSDFLKKIYDPFSQENTIKSNQYTGTGLGMSIVKNLVDLMGGSIFIESMIGRGTDVTVTLQVKFSDKNLNDDIDYGAIKGLHALIVDDNEINNMVARKLLESKGVFVDEANDGDIAYDMFKESDISRYDFILMDLRMKNLNGFEASKRIRALKREDSNITIIALSANTIDEVDDRIKESKAFDYYLTKPIDSKVLYSLLEKIKK